MGVYSVRGRFLGAETAADECYVNIWNPDSATRISLLELGVHHETSGAGGPFEPVVVRTTTAGGTPGSTVTPDADNAWHVGDAPPSGLVLHLGQFGTQPTLASPRLMSMTLQTAARSGYGYVWTFPRKLHVPPSRGIGLITGSNGSWETGEVYVVWEEG